MIRMGARLALAGGRSALVAVVMTAVAVAIGTAILLFALSFEPALQTRYAHIAWRDTPGEVDTTASATRGLLIDSTDDRFEGQEVVAVEVAALSADAPVPPGIPAVPAPGEAYLSPALASLVARTPADELGNRFGRVAGTIGDAGLKAPDELAAVVGVEPAPLQAAGGRAVTRLDTEPRIPPVPPILRLLILVVVIGALAPVAVFVATATRLSAARRERRLALLRLIGATPGQVYRLAAGEALVATVPGAAAGALLFWILRPAVALVPLDGLGWFPSAIVPSAASAAALLFAVQVVGVVAAMVALRRVSISPLGVTRRQSTRPLRRLRLLPLALGLAALVGGLVMLRDGAERDLPLYVTLGGFLTVIIGIVVAGPWLTMLVGRILARLARGASALLAARRLVDDPRAAFGAIAGVVMAVFVSAVFFTVAAYARDAHSRYVDVALAPGSMTSTVPTGSGSVPDRLATQLRAVPGVTAVAVLRQGVLSGPDGRDLQAAIVDCRDLAVSVLISPGCSAPVMSRDPAAIVPGTTYTFEGLMPGATGDTPADQRIDLASSGASVAAFRVEGGTGGSIPDVLLSPALVRDGGSGFAATGLFVATDGSARTQELARTLIRQALPTALAWTGAEISQSGISSIDELGRIVILGLLGTMVMAGCSLAVATASGLIERQRPFALLRLTGMPTSRLRSIVAIEAAAPLGIAALVSAGLGLMVGQLVLRLTGTDAILLPDVSSIVVLVLGVGAALAMVGLTLPMIGRLTDTEATRFE